MGEVRALLCALAVVSVCCAWSAMAHGTSATVAIDRANREALHLAADASDTLSTQLTALGLAKRNFHRHEDPLSPELADRTSLLFRSLDQDRDRLISAEDVRANVARLQTHMPGVTAAEFISFIDIADADGDHKLTRDELFQAIAEGMKEAETVPAELIKNPAAAPNFLEMVAESEKTSSVKTVAQGAVKAAGAVANKAMNWASDKLKGLERRVTGAIDISQDSCVMCQYIVERCEANVKQSGVIPGLSGAPVMSGVFSSYLEVDQHEDKPTDTAQPLPVLAELHADSQSNQVFLAHSGAGIIGSARQATRVQRQLERQKFNEIYRVVDISLDDVCEQGMPNSFYGYCKQVYKVQSDLVDGLRYQYRPADICFRIGMCGKNSYITKGIHSRYK